MSSVEEKLLLKSHSVERTKELLQARYSLRGDQKPYLVLTPTRGWTDANDSRKSSGPTTPKSTGDISQLEGRKIVTKGRRRSVRKNARTALNEYISKALRCRALFRSGKQLDGMILLPSNGACIYTVVSNYRSRMSL
jgi:ribonuclease P protein subunit POP4